MSKKMDISNLLKLTTIKDNHAATKQSSAQCANKEKEPKLRAEARQREFVSKINKLNENCMRSPPTAQRWRDVLNLGIKVNFPRLVKVMIEGNKEENAPATKGKLTVQSTTLQG